MSQNVKALKWQLMQSKLSENFGKWRPYLELFWGHRGAEISLGGGPLTPMEPPLNTPLTVWDAWKNMNYITVRQTLRLRQALSVNHPKFEGRVRDCNPAYVPCSFQSRDSGLKNLQFRPDYRISRYNNVIVGFTALPPRRTYSESK